MALDDIVSNRHPQYDVVIFDLDTLHSRQKQQGNYGPIYESINNGGFIFDSGSSQPQSEKNSDSQNTEYGPKDKIDLARHLMMDYKRFSESTEGKKLREMYGDATFNGYGVLDLGKDAVAAVIKTSDGRQYLTMNERFVDKVDEYDKLYLHAHEHLHGAGIDSEKGVESSLKSYFSELLEDTKEKLSDAKSWISTKGSYLADKVKHNAYNLAQSYKAMKQNASYRMQYAPD